MTAIRLSMSLDPHPEYGGARLYSAEGLRLPLSGNVLSSSWDAPTLQISRDNEPWLALPPGGMLGGSYKSVSARIYYDAGYLDDLTKLLDTQVWGADGAIAMPWRQWARDQRFTLTNKPALGGSPAQSYFAPSVGVNFSELAASQFLTIPPATGGFVRVRGTGVYNWFAHPYKEADESSCLNLTFTALDPSVYATGKSCNIRFASIPPVHFDLLIGPAARGPAAVVSMAVAKVPDPSALWGLEATTYIGDDSPSSLRVANGPPTVITVGPVLYLDTGRPLVGYTSSRIATTAYHMADPCEYGSSSLWGTFTTLPSGTSSTVTHHPAHSVGIYLAGGGVAPYYFNASLMETK